MVDHYENPRNVGSLDKNSKNVGTGLVGAPACGDVMKLQVCQPFDGCPHSLVYLMARISNHKTVTLTFSFFPLKIQVDDSGKIVDARFKTFGCGSAIASSSLATEWVKGKSVSLAYPSHRIAYIPYIASWMYAMYILLWRDSKAVCAANCY